MTFLTEPMEQLRRFDGNGENDGRQGKMVDLRKVKEKRWESNGRQRKLVYDSESFFYI